MNHLPLETQWIMAIIFPLQREFGSWVYVKFLTKSIDMKTTIPLIPKLVGSMSVNIGHAFFIATVLSSGIPPITCYFILSMDVVFNLYNSYKIIKIQTKVAPENLKIFQKTEETILLFLSETIEFLAPIAYIITFAMAYYGPNGELIGGVKNDDWGFKEVEDLHSFVMDLFLMVFVDFTCCIISALLLWKFSSTNFLREGYKMLKFCWPLASVKMAGILVMVRYLNYNFVYSTDVHFPAHVSSKCATCIIT
jgi:hypothetical protein